MPSAYVFEKTYNNVITALDTAKASGDLTYIKKVERGMKDRIQKGNNPTLTVWPSFNPDEHWAAFPDAREATFFVVAGIMQRAADELFPFGRSATPRKEGLLLTMADVMNTIDKARTDLCAVTEIADFDVVANDPEPIGQMYWIAEIVIRFRYRARAGLR